ncbi:hypothetical protein LX32DRAFT_222325 [Colletotrichum zoysiae]|uniref:Uncharacterized protein n=1 Tax=Colletotrichum zoysiae TaxID=1216348 RepID=A0AAD9LXM9_9PEZI|nr:hypothetical protein LX32DRAFT_222325 [Colletotrichum zoysiae]
MMASVPGLTTSYRTFDLDQGQYLSATPYGKSVLDRLYSCRGQLFINNHRNHKIPVRDVSAAGRVEKINLLNDENLKSFLGDFPGNEIESTSLCRPDEKCRFV